MIIDLLKTIVEGSVKIPRMVNIVGNMPNIKTKTLGGKIFWETIEESAGWKLQRNHVTGHCRIVDSDNVRQAWGEESAMKAKLRSFATQYNV